MTWIRVSTQIPDDPDIFTLADRLKVRTAEAVGLVVSLLTKFPDHAPDGQLGSLPGPVVERWAGWEGERGAFYNAIIELFVDADGVWPSWEKHNGAAMRDAEAARKRAAEYRRRNAEQLLKESANASPNSSGNASPNASPNGSPLRTNERTNITTSGRKRLFNGKTAVIHNGSTYAPGHVNLPDVKFCEHCGDGVADIPPGKRRAVQRHADDCPKAPNG